MLKWNIEDQEVTQKMVSSDKRWHISKRHNSKAAGDFFLSNFDILLTPHGTGSDYKECFESFIANCDKYVAKLAEIKEEAKQHLEELKTFDKELKDAN